jgi:hypothetical protein
MEGDGSFKVEKRGWLQRDDEILSAFPRPTPAFGLYGLRAGNRLVFAEPGSGQKFGRRIEKSCSSSFLASEEGLTASILALARCLAWKKRRHFATPDFLVAGTCALVIEESLRTAPALPDGFEQVAPGGQAMIRRIKHAAANERTAHQPEKIGALDDKRFDLDCHLATSS